MTEAAKADTEAKATETKPEAAPRTKEYMVVKTAIAPNGGRRKDIAQPGEKVALTAKQAKFYAEKGLLAPVVEADEE